MKRNSNFHFAICLAVSASIAFAPSNGAHAAPFIDPASIAAALASAMSGIAGTSSVANGTSNVNQGQSTQNQAQMAMGAMQILQGLLGLAAAAAAAGQSQKGQGNNDKMNNITGYDPGQYQSTVAPYTPPGSKPGETGTSNTGGATSGPGVIALTPENLRNGELGAAMTALEKNFGLPRDDVLKALQNGVDPKDILAKAPKNTPSMDTLNRIADGLAANSTAAHDIAKALGSGAGDGNLASAGGAGTGAPPAATTADDSKSVRMPASTAPPEGEEEAAANLALSPEVRAAMAAKAAQIKADKERKDSLGWSIFDLVHHRYRKLETMLYGRVERTNPNPSAPTSGF